MERQGWRDRRAPPWEAVRSPQGAELRPGSGGAGTPAGARLGGVRDDDTRLPSERFKKIVILAERAMEPGLTQEEAFPMMKNHRNPISTETRRHGSKTSSDLVLAFLPSLSAPW